jgi:hypothetical protein
MSLVLFQKIEKGSKTKKEKVKKLKKKKMNFAVF